MFMFLILQPMRYHLNEQTRVTKQYQGKISDNVRTILTEVLKTEEPLDIDETSLDINFFR